MDFKNYLLRVASGESLNKTEAKEAVNYMFSEASTEGEIGGFLLALKTKGESYEEIAGMAEGMRENALKFKEMKGLFDNCGTGGDCSGTFNISTTNSFLLAAAGVKVAKHGNRSISSKSGSADLLKSLGVNINLPKEGIEKLLEDIGIVFLFAPNMQPKFKKIMQVRRDLKIPTIFNILGPLANPFILESQLLGVYKKDLIKPIAEALKSMGRTGIVVNGEDRLDEGTLTGETYLGIISKDSIEYRTITPESLGFKRISLEDIRGGEPEFNRIISLDVLSGKKGPCRDTVVFNGALGLLAANKVSSIEEGISLSEELIDSKKALTKLNELIEGSQKYA
ncbi:anthranilate phosphoribosyltransferase [Clostridium paridis]|uniref:Anthranilate phosphoribosyltransferase n=1 Tax=Clostridium paridis TaxID=2803863 RepID=A0A937FJE0_9CLOT|nr:anthranilate phosphoribosyltransferase [Clostridium paridis]MBL4932866.1 anthranilate phosphoribosyltransferase [Clostridium paridis]